MAFDGLWLFAVQYDLSGYFAVFGFYIRQCVTKDLLILAVVEIVNDSER